ncbi:TonB-dependent receptor, partial [Enterovirga sp.]|uniref:TonB-dependent receptor plug domain-containing protein n=1 Tax=Enterovirga sp. TaxID=2026350 RepID=UPI002627BFA6
ARPSGGTAGAAAPPPVVVTPDRRPEYADSSSSAVSVVSHEEIQTFNPASLVDALRNVPGLDITETGGPGGSTSVRLRGANPGQTLVLIDGIRVNDPAAASGDFEFGSLLPTAIERIEVLRGPQSALYGSDAIGGVVNVITRRGDGKPRFETTTEAGSYGTVNTSATASGQIGPWSYALSGGGQQSAGFSRYGYRVGQLERRFATRHFEPDGFSRFGGYGRLGYDAGEGVKLDFGMLSFKTFAEYDAASSTLPSRTVATGPGRIFPDTPADLSRRFSQVFGRATAEQGPLTHTLTIFANQTDRLNDDFSYSNARNIFRQSFGSRTEFRGDRLGTEYQGDLRLGAFGTLTYGGKAELEKARTFTTGYVPLTPRTLGVGASQFTRSAFLLYQLPVGERLTLSAGARHDEVDKVSFDTWRTTASFLIPETGTKLRASAGTGGKAPTLFQLFDPRYGTPTLNPETSFGWDAGIDQTLWTNRLFVAATVFGNEFKNLISFDGNLVRTGLGAGSPSLLGGYRQTARAETSGVELEATLVALPGWMTITSAYTYLHAKDLGTGLTLQRRPQHVGRVSVALTPLPGFLIEPRVTFVSRRFSGNGETQPLPRYGRLDVYSEYRINETWKVFGRAENVTDARYQEVLNYGTTGRAFYGGLNATW